MITGVVVSLWLERHSCIIHINKLHGQERDLGIFDTSSLEEILKGVSRLDSSSFIGKKVRLKDMIAIPLTDKKKQELDWDKGDWQILTVQPFNWVRDVRLLPNQYYAKGSGRVKYFPTLAYCQQGIPQATDTHVTPENVAHTIHLFQRLVGAWNNFPVEEMVNVIQNNDNFSNVRKFFPSQQEALSFFESYPQYFSLKDENRTVFIPYRFSQDGLSTFLTTYAVNSSQLEREDVAYELVESLDACRHHVTTLQGRVEIHPLVLTVGCESVEPGREGSLTLLQIGTMKGEVFIFDLLATPRKKDMIIDGGLKGILEDEKIVKVMYDCRDPQASLFYQFGVTLTNVFDISGAYALILDQCNFMSGPNRPSSPAELLEAFGTHARHRAESFEKEMKDNRLFEKRPLTEEMIEYVVNDAKCWVPKVYESLNRLISPLWRPEFQNQVERWLEASRTGASAVPQE